MKPERWERFKKEDVFNSATLTRSQGEGDRGKAIRSGTGGSLSYIRHPYKAQAWAGKRTQRRWTGRIRFSYILVNKYLLSNSYT